MSSWHSEGAEAEKCPRGAMRAPRKEDRTATHGAELVKLQEPSVSYKTAVVGPPRGKGGGRR